uniref:Uncharacterized protein n=2 Tax=Avena sativa TaxID=4498 RepID=A0ACD5UWR0_AVESA
MLTHVELGCQATVSVSSRFPCGIRSLICSIYNSEEIIGIFFNENDKYTPHFTCKHLPFLVERCEVSAMAPSMEEPLVGGNVEKIGGPGDSLVVIEVKKQLYLAGPLIVGSLLQNIVQMISVMFVGHLGELALSSASIATSFAGVTGFSLLAGMSTSLDTLCGQAFGAKQYHLLGIYKQRAILVLNTISLVFRIPSGLSAAISTRVSNELGAGRPNAARLATQVIMVLGIVSSVSVGLVMILVRNLWGYAYSNEKEVVEYVSRIMPILAVTYLFDDMQCVLSGIVRGCGFQKIGAYVNLSAYYLVGIPAALCFAFVYHLDGVGLWSGIICGLVVQTVLLLTITLRTNWDKEALKAKNRVFGSSLPVDLAT